ncbi:MAG: restriction endonuclease [Holosporaceae bacterium]|jgi:hypothetical protein|nr:restriction endonuclease [Holosporaceae bacterium]
MADWEKLFPATISKKYEIHNFNHAAEILSQAYEEEFNEILTALDEFSISISDIISGGGNESAIPKKLSAILHPKNWEETKITGDLIVYLHKRNKVKVTKKTIKNFIGGHNIDYIKGKIALDMEWNSKDQTFDRDLYAFRAFYECGIIACGVIVTRSESLNQAFSKLGVISKYGASTTWMGKLLSRINSGRHGGCPLLALGITPAAIVDLEENL